MEIRRWHEQHDRLGRDAAQSVRKHARDGWMHVNSLWNEATAPINCPVDPMPD